MNNNNWVVYPEISFTMDDIVKHLEMTENNEKIANLLSEVNSANENLIVGETLTEDEIEEGINASEDGELSEEELKALYVQQLKNSKSKVRQQKHPVKKVGTDIVVMKNITINSYGVEYKKARKKKNKLAKASRKANRK
jgi:hypothetical protein